MHMETNNTNARLIKQTPERKVQLSVQSYLNAVFSSKNQNSKKKFQHLHGDLNLDEIKKRIAQFACKSRDESNGTN